MTNPILATALQLLDAGYSVLPIRDDGSKAPAISTWKQYMTAAPTRDEVTAWFGPARSPFGLGVVTGHNHHEMTELEGRAVHALPDLAALATDTGLGDLWQRVAGGWLEQSPSGGIHFHYRITDGDVPGNLKLARDMAGLVLAETRGAGGQTVIAPTPGAMHPSGKPWVRLAGGPATAAVLTMAERDAFHALLRTLDEQPDQGPTTVGAVTPHDPTAGVTPGDDYENRTDWADILTPHGWTLVSARGRTRYWLRPGKAKGQGISATTGHADDRDRLYVFTSSTDFAPEIPYTKLGAYALLEHGGDHTAAAKELRRRGFGQAATALTPADDLAGLIAPTNGDTSWATTPAPAADTTSNTTTSGGETEPGDGASLEAAPVPGPTPTTDVAERDATPDQDNTALLLVDTNHHLLRHVPGRGWLAWDTYRWTPGAHTAQEAARTLARRLPTGEGWNTYRKTALSARGVDGVLKLAATDPRIHTDANNLDARPYELNTPAGAYNLRTATLLPTDPAALHTRHTSVAPDFDAPHPRWDRFLAMTFAGEPDMIEYVRLVLGVTIIGAVLEQILLFAQGQGKNGKSTLMETVQRILGIGPSGYAASAPSSLLIATRNEGHPTEIARLAGARMVVTSEIEEGQRFAEAKVKLLTGSDTLTGRFMGKDFFDFRPTHTLWTLSNPMPEVRTGGPAFWRRVRLLKFPHEVPEELRILDLGDQLVHEEGPAILAWMIRGARDYLAHGLHTPAVVTSATDAYQHETDTVARFVEERCELGDPNAQHMTVTSAAVRAAYEAWCRVEGETPVSQKALVQQLIGRFAVRSARSNNSRYLSGMRLTDVSPDDDDASRGEPPTLAVDGW
ncbi:phage/plasmid primase, P4 family [Xylanimonas ulmi]|uniref:Putative DNA primase/helicase n=1 Tax=Xylanimonas ulmi TaxID=228973 RepID=A0A4Q7M6H0_9MICO|nr:phage/plasmid primase, P4 family [Xylanibacterium ulmi]RZS61669.1 putative DNA primase/helicase [Xylanibacterium ulmi]